MRTCLIFIKLISHNPLEMPASNYQCCFCGIQLKLDICTAHSGAGWPNDVTRKSNLNLHHTPTSKRERETTNVISSEKTLIVSMYISL